MGELLQAAAERVGTCIENLGGRRFLLCGLVSWQATFLQAFGHLDADGNAYVFIMLGVIGGYVTGNTVQKIKGMVHGGTQEPPAR